MSMYLQQLEGLLVGLSSMGHIMKEVGVDALVQLTQDSLQQRGL